MLTRSLISLLAILIGSGAHFYLAWSQEPTVPAWHLNLHQVTLSRIDSDSISATLAFTVTADRDATLRDVVFDQTTVNGVPVHVPPLKGPIALRRGQMVDGFSTIEGRMDFRELTSLDPLREVVRSGKADVHATVRAELELNLFKKLTLLAGSAWAVTEVNQQVPVNLPGGALGKAAAFAVITAADPIWIAGQAGREWRRNQSEFAEQAADGMANSLVLIETTYELRSQNGEVTAVRGQSTGFLMPGGRILTVAETVQPWTFLPSLAEALHSGTAKLISNHTEISASLLATTPDQAVQPLSLQKRELEIVRMSGRAHRAISPDTQRHYPLRFRATDDNAAILKAEAWKRTPHELKFAEASSVLGWRPAAVYRIRLAAGGPKAVLWLTEAREEGGHYRLKDPLDSTAFGSPVWIGNGVAGILQTEDAAAEIGAVLGRLK